ALVVLDGGFLDALQATDAGADGHADAVGVRLVDFQPRVGDRHQRRCHAVMDEGIHLLDVLRRDPAAGVEVLHLARDPGGEGGRVEMGDRADPRTPGNDAVPARGQVVAERRQDADAGDGDAALGHVRLSPLDSWWRRAPAGRGAPHASRHDVGLDVVYRLLHRGGLLGCLVGDLALQFFFERHHQFDGVERIRAEVVDEGSVGADFLFLAAQLFDDDLLDAFFDAAHWL